MFLMFPDVPVFVFFHLLFFTFVFFMLSMFHVFSAEHPRDTGGDDKAHGSAFWFRHQFFVYHNKTRNLNHTRTLEENHAHSSARTTRTRNTPSR